MKWMNDKPGLPDDPETRAHLAYRFFLYEHPTTGRIQDAIWNARPGWVYEHVPSLDGNTIMVWRGVSTSPCPDYVPSVGERVYVDMTAARARMYAVIRLEELERKGGLALQQVQDKYESREAAIAAVAALFYRPDAPGAPDLVIVTVGFLEELRLVREALGIEWKERLSDWRQALICQTPSPRKT